MTYELYGEDKPPRKKKKTKATTHPIGSMSTHPIEPMSGVTIEPMSTHPILSELCHKIIKLK